MLDEIIDKNAQLYKYRDMIPMLYQLEEFIPINSRDNFYHNLSTLKVETSPNDSSYYKVRENVIGIRSMSFDNFSSDISREDRVRIEFIRRRQCIFHELIHMASTRIDPTNNMSYCGFSTTTRIDNTYFITNNNLNEGFTELFTELHYPKYDPDYAYLDYTSIASILTMISDIDYVKEIFFRGGYISNLKDKLTNFSNIDSINHLFCSIERAGKKNNPRTLVIYDILRNDLLDIIYNALSYWVDNGVFDSYQDGRYFVYNNINPLIKNLLSMMKTDKIDYASAKEDLIQICNTYQDKLINKVKILKK